MYKGKVLALILAGGVGGRLGLLTEKRAKPVMPFAGNYRLIDFSLSNCLHSNLNDVWVIEQYELHSLNEHLANGRPWDLDRTYGGLLVLPPFEKRENNKDKGGFAEGNADAILRHRDLIEQFNPDLLIVLSADHVYKFDYRDAIETHLEKKASVTMVTTRLPEGEDASRFGVVEVNKTGRITKFDYKPEKPQSDLITTEIFVYDARILLKTLKELNEKQDSIKDYGHELVPHFVEQGRAFEHRFNGYWRDVGTIETYWKSQIDFLDDKKKFVFDDEDWQILTLSAQRAPAFIHKSAEITNSLIANGSRIYGKVSHSVLSSGVTIKKGAEVADSIVLPRAVVETGVKIKRAIIDAEVHLTRERAEKIEAARGKQSNEIIVVGKRKIQSSKEIES
jgi:glucose-1-phosphate adenylyltransferase